MTALMMAAANGFEACVRELLYAGTSQEELGAATRLRAACLAACARR